MRRVLAHYETQTEEEAVAEDERGRTVVEIPIELMPVIREVIAQYEARVKA